VPVTGKLSRKFYDALGDDVANELVEWFNQVDLTYRTELRELNELNFARFDAKLEQRVAQLDAKLEQRIAELRAELRIEFRQGLTQVDSKLDRLRAELIKWMFLFWLGTVGLVLTLVTQLR
jgi:ABC-type phosphate transport system auxiliary subunit